MGKSKKPLAVLALLAMLLMLIPMQAFALDDTASFLRLSGATRVGTAIAIANSGWANGATNVVVVPANDANLVDALAVAPLAKQLNAPVLITDKASLDASVSAEIATLKATTVYAVGALSDAVVSQLKALSGVTVTQVKGADRFATAAQIASMLTSPAGSVVVGYNGLADALSAASYAAANGYAILVANTDGTVPANEAAYEGSKVIVLGGPTLVADIAGATRYYGSDRYATNDEVIKNLSFQYDKVYVANGETLVDALPGAVLAALSGSPIVLANANTQGAAVAADVYKNLTTSSQVVAFGGAAVVPDSVVTSVQTGSTGGTVPSGPVAVQSVKASAANAITVAFTSAPADTSKVTFAVDLSGTAVTVTPTWNDSNTQATLTGSANFAPGTYNVGVKNDTTDLGSNTVTFTQQAIAKIEITSKVFAVTTLIGGDSNQAIHNGDGVKDGSGFITYAVTDQYGNDITDSALANSITWTPGISQDYVAKNGVITVAPPDGMSFNQYTSMSITGYDSSTGISTSATLSISNTGPLSGITLEKLTSPNNDDLNANNTTGQWYIDYTALDASGNPTKDLKMINEGILNNSNINGGGFLDVKVVADPNDSTKAAISVTLSTSSTPPATDMQIPITVVTTNGKSSTLNVTLKKAANKVDSIILGAPAQMVASNDTIDIPFTATDPTGKVLTNFSDLQASNNVTITASSGDISTTGNIDFVRNSDGTAAIEYTAPPVAQNATGPLTVYLSATVTTTGKFSQVTISIQKPAIPDALLVDNTKVLQYMQVGSKQNFDFGSFYFGLTLKDQYGRVMNMTNADQIGGQYTDVNDVSWNYYVYPRIATASGNYLQITGNFGTGSPVLYQQNVDTMIALAPGTPSVTYEVWRAPVGGTMDPTSSTNVNTGISKTVTYTVLKDSDITGYTLDAIAKPLHMLTKDQILAASGGGAQFTGPGTNDNWGSRKMTNASSAYEEYAANPFVWGKTSGGAKVVLNASKVAAVSIDSNDFALLSPLYPTGGTTPAAVTISDPGVNNFVIFAHDITKDGNLSTASSSSTNLTVTVKDSSGNFVNVTTPVQSVTDSSTATAVSTNMATYNAPGNRGIKLVGSNSYQVNLTEARGTFDKINGKVLVKYTDMPGAVMNNISSRSCVFFKSSDQWVGTGAPVNLVQLNGQSFANNNVNATVINDVNGTPTLKITRKSESGVYAAGSLINSTDTDFSELIQNGDYIIISASAPNGKLGTMKLVFVW